MQFFLYRTYFMINYKIFVATTYTLTFNYIYYFVFFSYVDSKVSVHCHTGTFSFESSYHV